MEINISLIIELINTLILNLKVGKLLKEILNLTAIF